MKEDTTRLAVANGQIWRGRLRYQTRDALWTVVETAAEWATIRMDGEECTSGITIESLIRWPCVGIETTAGRVMVGERRGTARGMYVRAVIDGATVVMHPEADGPLWGSGYTPAALVASWPLLPPAPAQGAARRGVYVGGVDGTVKTNAAAALREVGESLADQARRSGVGHMSDSERATLRAYLATLTPAKRLREAYGLADRANETAVDEVWTVLGREPSAEEYREMAKMFRKAAATLDADAKRVGK